MAEKPEQKDESLLESVCQLVESGALVMEEIIHSLKPSEEECRRFKRRFWEFQAKIASGLSTIAEKRLRDIKTDTGPRHADRIIVEEDA